MTSQDHRMDYLRFGETPADIEDGVLYCDPLTTLVAYPSFEQCLVKMLPSLAPDELHIAIGDVDGLREYVSERRATDPCSFGHLAGNACMRTVGTVTSHWAAAELADLPFSLCGTFGGDEVIVAVTGLSHEAFAEKIEELCRAIKVASPRPCSFALATLERCTLLPGLATIAYRVLVSMVDGQLFYVKECAHLAGAHLDGSISDLGMVAFVEDELIQEEIDCRPATIGDGL